VRAIAIVLRWMLVVGLLACAGSQQQGADEPKSYVVTKKVGEKLQEVQQLAADKEWAKALETLADIEQSKYLNDHERARIFQIRAGLYAQQDATANMPQITEALEQAVKLDALEEADQRAMEFNLGETYIMLERFPEAAATLSQWIKQVKNPAPSGYFLTASAFAQAGNFAEAEPYAKEAVARAPKPEEPWLRLLISIEYETKDEAGVAAALEKLLAAFPSKAEDWLLLAETYAALDQGPRALATLEKASAQGVLKDEKQIVKLAQSYAQHGDAAKGAALLESSFDSGAVTKTPESLDVYARAWLKAGKPEQATERVKAAAQTSGSGELWLLLGRLESERAQWAAAQAALSQALKLGGLRSEGDAQLLLGVAHYNQKNEKAALAAWGEAKKHPASAQEAQRWISEAQAKKGGKK
jgi:cytochrome c-type biogenesis protein CcmH/NrfG